MSHRAKLASMMQSFSRRLRSLLPMLLLLIAASALALALAEVAVRLIRPQQLIIVRADVWQGKDTLGWAKRPNLETTINTGEGTVHLVTDSLGFRIPADGRASAANPGRNKKRVMLLGDSMMEALQVEYGESLAGRLETRLSGALGEPVEVWNTGVACWGPSQYLLQGRSLLERLPFEYVIVAVYVANDAQPRRKEYFPPRQPTVVHRLRLPRRPTWSEIRFALLYPVNDFLERRSHLFIAFKSATETLRARFQLGGEDYPFAIRRSEAASPRWEVTAETSQYLEQIAAQHDVPTVFLLIPASYQVDASWFEEVGRAFSLEESDVDLDQPNRLLAEAMTAKGLNVVDLLPQMRSAHNNGVQLYGSVDRHLTPEGHALLEEIVGQIVEREIS